MSVGQGRVGREVPSKEHDPRRADVRGERTFQCAYPGGKSSRRDHLSMKGSWTLVWVVVAERLGRERKKPEECGVKMRGGVDGTDEKRL